MEDVDREEFEALGKRDEVCTMTRVLNVSVGTRDEIWLFWILGRDSPIVKHYS
jgi:hypothetical protein